MSMYWIAGETVSANGSAVNFYSIPSTYSHLQVRVFARGMTSFSSGLTLYINLNNDSTSSNYYNHGLFGDGASTYGVVNANPGTITVQQVLPDSSATANIMGSVIIDINDYTSTTKSKTIKSFGGNDRNGSGRIMLYSGVWKPSTPAVISQVTLNTDGGFLAGSRIDLYGIATNPIATGA